MDFMLELPPGISPQQRDDLIRELQAHAQVTKNEAASKTAAFEVLMILTATIQALGVIYMWSQAVRANNRRIDIVIKLPDGTEIHLKDVTWDELRRFWK